MIIRDAGPDDVAPCSAIIADAYRRNFAPLLPDADLSTYDEAHFARRFDSIVTQPDAGLLRVADAAGEVIGFYRLVRREHIELVFVARSHRGSGVGATLLRDAMERGAGTLECFRANVAALRFYEQQGWRREISYGRDFAGGARRFVRMIADTSYAGRPLPAGATLTLEDDEAC